MTQHARGRAGVLAVVLCSVVAACAGPRAAPKPQAASVPTGAQQLFKAMAQRYATSRTYEDKGIVDETIYPDDGSAPHSSHFEFQTAFDRGTGGFRFEYSQPEPLEVRGVIWSSDPGPVRVWWTLRPEVRVEHRNVAIGGFGGITRGASYEIPLMLFGSSVPVPVGLVFNDEGEEAINGTACTKVSAHDDKRTVVLWIGRSDQMLRKFFERTHLDGTPPAGFDAASHLPPDLAEANRKMFLEAIRKPQPFVAETTLEYSPTVDGAVDPAKFAFTPPAISPLADLLLNRHHDYCAGQDVVAKGTDPLIDDLEDGDGKVREVDGRSGEWYTFSDSGCVLDPPDKSPAGGEIALIPSRSTKSKFAMRAEGHGCNDWGFGVGVQLHRVGGPACAYNATVYDGVYFWGRSGKGPASVRFQVGTRQTMQSLNGGDGSCETTEKGCWDYHSAPVALTPDWRMYAFKWTDLKQAGWGKPATFDPALLTNLQWMSDVKGPSVEIWVDQIAFFKGDYPKK